MNAKTLGEIIDAAMKLPADQREMLVSILNMRQIEARRREIALDAQESLAAFRMKKLKALSAEGTIHELQRALEGDE